MSPTQSKRKADSKLIKRIRERSRENIFSKIPLIKDYYWIVTKKEGIHYKTHDSKLILRTGYHHLAFSILDIDNRILYYYEYAG